LSGDESAPATDLLPFSPNVLCRHSWPHNRGGPAVMPKTSLDIVSTDVRKGKCRFQVREGVTHAYVCAKK
jgi:hypothetical protein